MSKRMGEGTRLRTTEAVSVVVSGVSASLTDGGGGTMVGIFDEFVVESMGAGTEDDAAVGSADADVDAGADTPAEAEAEAEMDVGEDGEAEFAGDG